MIISLAQQNEFKFKQIISIEIKYFINEITHFPLLLKAWVSG
jgi:hypothetical protein